MLRAFLVTVMMLADAGAAANKTPLETEEKKTRQDEACARLADSMEKFMEDGFDDRVGKRVQTEDGEMRLISGNAEVDVTQCLPGKVVTRITLDLEVVVQTGTGIERICVHEVDEATLGITDEGIEVLEEKVIEKPSYAECKQAA